MVERTILHLEAKNKRPSRWASRECVRRNGRLRAQAPSGTFEARREATWIRLDANPLILVAHDAALLFHETPLDRCCPSVRHFRRFYDRRFRRKIFHRQTETAERLQTTKLGLWALPIDGNNRDRRINVT